MTRNGAPVVIATSSDASCVPLAGEYLASGQRGQDGDDVARLDGRVELLQEPYVFVVDVDVDEAVQRTVFHGDLLAEAGEPFVHALEHLGDRVAFGLDRFGADYPLQH